MSRHAGNEHTAPPAGSNGRPAGGYRRSIPTASACSHARCHAPACAAPSARRTFPPFVPVTSHWGSAFLSGGAGAGTPSPRRQDSLRGEEGGLLLEPLLPGAGSPPAAV